MRLACDGPRNGEYLSGPEALAAGYVLAFWPTGEVVWMRPLVRAIFGGSPR